MQKVNILPQIEMERLFLYADDSKTNAAFDKIARKVFSNIVQNLGIDVDDFQFMLFDNGTKNAFFISADKTLNGKNLIAVSADLLKSISSYDELAAVMGHECGHYVWKHTLGGENTIFQERGSDLYAVDLLINGGYNPTAITSVYNDVFAFNQRRAITMDVHGSPWGRIQDVNAYLTKISSEKGDFPILERHNVDFIADVNDVLGEEEASENFFAKHIFQKFGVKNLSFYKNLTIADFEKLMLDLLNSGAIVSKDRAESFLYIIESTLDKYKRASKEEIELEREIFIKFQQQTATYGDDIALKLFDKLRISKSDEFFGPFLEQAENLQKFIDSAYDEEQAVKYAELCEKNIWTVQYTRFFRNKWPRFKALGKNNVGKMLPWVHMQKYSSEACRNVLSKLLGDKINTYSIPEYDSDMYYLDKNNVVLEYGKNAQKLILDNELNRLKERLTPVLEHLNMLTKVSKGEVSIAEYSTFVKENGGLKRLESIVSGNIDFNFINDEFIEKNQDSDAYLEEIYKMDFFKEIYKKNNLVREFKDLPKEKLKKINFFTSCNFIKELKFMYADVLMQLAEYRTNTEQEKVLYSYIDYENTDVDLLYSIVESFALRDIEPYLTLYNSLVLKIFESNYSDSVVKYIYQDKLSRTISEELKEFKRIKTKLKFDIALTASKNRIYVKNSVKELYSYILEEFDKGKKSQVFKNVLNTMGKKELQTPDELWDLMKSTEYKNELKEFFIMDYILSGKKLYVYGLLKDMEVYPVSSVFSDVLAEYMINNKILETENLDVKIEIFHELLKRNAFSEKKANKIKFAKIIINELVSNRDFNNPQCQKNVDNVRDILLRKLLVQNDDKHDEDLEFFKERELLIDFYADYFFHRFGPDDGSDEYIEKLEPVINLIKGDKKTTFSSVVANSFVRKFSDKIIAQKRVAKILEDAKIRRISGKTAEEYDYYGRGAEALISVLSNSSDRALAAIEFLSSEFTDINYALFISKLDLKDIERSFKEYLYVRNMYDNTYKVSKESFMVLHENFWSVDLQIRAVIMNRLFNAAFYTTESKIKFIHNLFFDKDSEYSEDAYVIINAVYNNLKDYERDLIMSAIICAGKKDENNNMTGGQAIGNGLKMFLQNKGPAFIKFGQLLSYMPKLDSEIRAELATLRDKADIPSRYELFEMLDNILPEDEKRKITHVGKILGAGSFYVTVQLEYDGRECVIGLMRPNVAELTESGMRMIDSTVSDIVEKKQMYKPLKKIVKQARASAESEIDIESDYQKYLNAVDLYEKLQVSTPTGDYSPDVAKWMAHGKNSQGTAYKIMEMAKGSALTDDEWTVEEKHDFAVAYVTLELCILLSGQQWDTDRHQGQQNFYNNSFRDFVIGIFDTAAQMDKKPNVTDKVMLGMMLFDMLDAEQSGKDLSDVLMSETDEKFEKRYGATPTYIDGVKRGLTALSDIIEYQKEIKDENGNIIQESKKLTRDDMQNIISAVVNSGIVSKTVLSTIGAKAIINGMLTNMVKYAIKGRKLQNPIKVSYTKKDNNKVSERIDKSEKELQELLKEKRKGELFGIDKRFIDTDNNNK